MAIYLSMKNISTKNKRLPFRIVVFGSATGTRTPVYGVRGRCPRPLDDSTLVSFFRNPVQRYCIFLILPNILAKKNVFFVKKVQINLISHHTYDKKRLRRASFMGWICRSDYSTTLPTTLYCTPSLIIKSWLSLISLRAWLVSTIVFSTAVDTAS